MKHDTRRRPALFLKFDAKKNKLQDGREFPTCPTFNFKKEIAQLN